MKKNKSKGASGDTTLPEMVCSGATRASSHFARGALCVRLSIMAEARQPIHLLDVCNQKFSEFLFNAEHKCLVWLREIEEEAMKIFDRLSKGHGSLKTESFQKVSPRRVLNSLNVGDAISLPDIMTNSSKGTSKVQSDRIAMGPVGEPLGTGCCKIGEIQEKRNEGMNGIPEIFIAHSDDHLADSSRVTEIPIMLDSPAMLVPNIADPIKAEKNGNASRLPSIPTLKESLNGKHTSGEEIPPQELLNNNLDPEGELSQGLKESSAASAGSLSGHRRLSRPHKTPRISLVEKYSLSNKRKSTIRKSISRTIARKQVAQDSSSASSRVSCHSSTEIFLNDENHKDGPLTQNAELGEPLNSLQKEPCALDASSLIVSTPMHNPTQFERHQDKTCNKDRLETIITDSYISNSEDLARNNSSHEPMQNIRKQSYRQAVEDLPAPSCTEDKNPSPFSHTTTSTSAKKMLPTSGPSKIIQPFKNFFQTMQKNQLLKSPGSSGNKVPKHSTPCKSATKEKERQRLESLRKKQEAEQQRKQKVEEEKRRRLEEIKLKREERLRKALQARERVEQMEEEKKKRMEQKFSQLDERNDKMREEKTAEEKTKKSIKKIEAEFRKLKLPQMEEGPKLQERPEKWRTIGEIKKMLEINCNRQEKGHQRHQDKEKLVKVQELTIVKEEEENVKEEENPASQAQLQQDETAVQVETVPAACGWLNITAQKCYSGSSNQVDAQGLKDTKSLKINLNDYGMDLNSDDSTDDESQPSKPIPLWASGVQLNEAVTYQYYNPPDINRLFGLISSPKLENIFYKSKPRYFKRTSSAVWQSPPLPGSKPALRMSNSMKKY
ncbi:inner centromere protein-like isoform X2 [Crotalus tigris]|uniref:inner centromere protein-like isoform X2 n=1 Tax=Crotalus tigris TaxID=88082 RepID=UPI00192F20E7|nr:inner centromere protein-like isoform X2 [Crotalus tigris]